MPRFSQSLRLEHSELAEIREYLETIARAIAAEKAEPREALDGLREIFGP